MKHIEYLRNDRKSLLNHRKNLLSLIEKYAAEKNVSEVIKYSKQLEETQTKLYMIEKWIDMFNNVLDY